MILYDDVLYLIFSWLKLNDLLNSRLVCKRFKEIIDKYNLIIINKLLSSHMKKFTLLSKESIGIKYYGYSVVILNYNYKIIDAISYILHAKTFGLAVKAGIRFTTNRWKTFNEIIGKDIRQINTPDFVEDPLPVMKKKGSYDEEKELEWFYDEETSGWIFDTFEVSFKLIFDPFDGCFWDEEIWFAFFVEDMYGNKYWDNNNGWNYDIKNSTKISIQHRGWHGT